jgi:hypothetical protein
MQNGQINHSEVKREKVTAWWQGFIALRWRLRSCRVGRVGCCCCSCGASAAALAEQVLLLPALLLLLLLLLRCLSRCRWFRPWRCGEG